MFDVIYSIYTLLNIFAVILYIFVIIVRYSRRDYILMLYAVILLLYFLLSHPSLFLLKKERHRVKKCITRHILYNCIEKLLIISSYDFQGRKSYKHIRTTSKIFHMIIQRGIFYFFCSSPRLSFVIV